MITQKIMHYMHLMLTFPGKNHNIYSNHVHREAFL